MHEWEPFATDGTDRLRIPGGWLYRTEATSRDCDDLTVGCAMVFVPEQEGVCSCFVTKPCTRCLGEHECSACNNTGRKREPKCDKCIAEGRP